MFFEVHIINFWFNVNIFLIFILTTFRENTNDIYTI